MFLNLRRAPPPYWQQYFDTANTGVMISQGFSILSAYQDDYTHATQPNWDGAGAVALTRPVIELAERVISRFGTTEHLVEVAPGRDGSLSFVWDDGNGNYIYLDIGPGDTVHLYRDTIADGKWEAVSVAGEPRILGELGRAFRGTRWPLHQLVVRFDAQTPSGRPILLAAA